MGWSGEWGRLMYGGWGGVECDWCGIGVRWVTVTDDDHWR